jgi:hypothetical protein
MLYLYTTPVQQKFALIEFVSLWELELTGTQIWSESESESLILAPQNPESESESESESNSDSGRDQSRNRSQRVDSGYFF